MEGLQERENEEKLREASSNGDLELLRTLVELKSVNVNSQHKMNGRYDDLNPYLFFFLFLTIIDFFFFS